MRIQITKQYKTLEDAREIAAKEREGFLDKIYYSMYKKKELEYIGGKLIYHPYFLANALMTQAGAKICTPRPAVMTADGFFGVAARVAGRPLLEEQEADPSCVVSTKITAEDLQKIAQEFLGRLFLKKCRGRPQAQIVACDKVYKPVAVLSYRHGGELSYKCVDAESGDRVYWLEPYVEELQFEAVNS